MPRTRVTKIERMAVSIPPFVVVKLENKGKRERWVARWAVVETISGENLSVGRFVYKKTAEMAARGGAKSGERLVKTFLADSGEKSSRAGIVLKRYFQAYAAKEGFKPSDRYVCRYSQLRLCKK